MAPKESGSNPLQSGPASGTPYIGTELAVRRARQKSGGSGGDSGDTESRVTRLETHMEYVRRDLDEIRSDLKTVVQKVDHLPTKGDLETWRGQWLIIGVGIVALVVGGVVGGLALINHYAANGPSPMLSTPTPIVIQTPAQSLPVQPAVVAKHR